jgi:hypothetical protein
MSLLPDLLGGSIYSIKTPHFHYRGFLTDECKLIEGKLKIYGHNLQFIAVVKIIDNNIIKVYNYDPETIKYATSIFNKFINVELLTNCKNELNIRKDVTPIPLIKTPLTDLIEKQKADKQERARERYEEGVERRAEEERIAEEARIAEQRRRVQEARIAEQLRREEEAIDHVEQLKETIIYGTQSAIDKDTSPVEPININEVGYDVINIEDIKIFDFIKNNENNSIIIKHGKRIFLFNKNDFNETLTDSAKVHPCIIANSSTVREVVLPLRNIKLPNVIKNIPLYNLGSILGINILVSQVLLDKFVKEIGNVFIRIDKQLYTYDGVASYDIIYNDAATMSGLHCNKGVEKINLWSIKRTIPLMTVEEEKELREVVFKKEEQKRIAREEQRRKEKGEQERIAELRRIAKEEQERKQKEQQERIAELRRKEKEEQERKEKEDQERIAELRRKEKEEQERKEKEEQERIAEEQRKEKEEQERIAEEQRKEKEKRITEHHRKAQEFIEKRSPFLNEIIEKVSKEKIYWTYTGEWTLNQWIDSTHRTNEKKAGILGKLKEDIDKDLIKTYLISDFVRKYSRSYIIENYENLLENDYDIFIKYIEELKKQVATYYRNVRLKYLKYKNKYLKLKKLQIVK